MNGDNKAALYVAGAILAGSGGITIGLGTIAGNGGDLVIAIGFVLLLIGLAILAFNWAPFVSALDDLWTISHAPRHEHDRAMAPKEPVDLAGQRVRCADNLLGVVRSVRTSLRPAQGAKLDDVAPQ